MLACQEDIVTGYFTTERHDRLRWTVREFAETKVRPLIPEMEASKSVQHTLSRLIARQGWIGVTIGHQYFVLGMEATAERDGDDYVLNGRKVHIGNSHVGDLHGVVVRTGTGSKGLSAFLVDSDQPGLSLAPHKQAMGLHGFSFGELIFDNCRVPVPPD